ncbi:MAG: hypothetical protein ACQETA_00220 [Bacteroidota bacterium]
MEEDKNLNGTERPDRNTGSGDQNSGNGDRNTGNGDQNTGSGDRNTGNGDRNTGGGDRNTGSDDPNTGGDDRKRNKTRTIMVVIAGVLGTVLAAMIILYFIQRNNMVEMETLLTEQKDSLTNELVMLKHGYDTLKTNNDTLNARLEEEVQKIERLLAINASNVQTIRTYRKEITTMREIMKSYIVQIDSLNTRNQLLMAENVEIKEQMRQVEQSNVALSQERSELSSKVEVASVIKAREIKPVVLNKKRKETDRLDRFEKLEVAFILNENPIVEAGKLTVYMRVTRPDGLVITNSPDNYFELDGERMFFTENRTVDYLNKDVEMSIFVDNNGDFIEGTYKIDLYLDGHNIGSSSFMLRGR